MDEENGTKHWEDFYTSNNGENKPSPFAVFVEGKIRSSSLVIDVGCGNGRDSNFFLNKGHSVIALDGSEAAVNRLSELFRGRQNFMVGKHVFGEDLHTLVGRVNDFVRSFALSSPPNVVIYNRFFIHAINEVAESAFLDWISSKPSGFVLENVYFEYRTLADADTPKKFGNHYRRYVNPSEFESKLVERKFTVEHLGEGQGFAMMGDEDPFVCRQSSRLAI